MEKGVKKKKKSISRQLLKRKVSGLKEESENIPQLFHWDLAHGKIQWENVKQNIKET